MSFIKLITALVGLVGAVAECGVVWITEAVAALPVEDEAVGGLNNFFDSSRDASLPVMWPSLYNFLMRSTKTISSINLTYAFTHS